MAGEVKDECVPPIRCDAEDSYLAGFYATEVYMHSVYERPVCGRRENWPAVYSRIGWTLLGERARQEIETGINIHIDIMEMQCHWPESLRHLWLKYFLVKEFLVYLRSIG